MFVICSGRVFLDKNFEQKDNGIDFFKSCVKIDNLIFPEYFELDPIDVASYIIKNPCAAKIVNSEEFVSLDKDNVFQYIESNLPRFKVLCYLANDLRSQGWFLRRGVNYGADFLLYDSNPDVIHSRYAVYLMNSAIEDQWSNILGMNRVCVNAKKLMLLAVADPVCEGKFKYVEMKRWIPESNRE